MKQELELYVHIPFCVKKCAYCDFLSGPGTFAEQKAYVQAIIKEIHGYHKRAFKYEVSSIFVGGGTPSVLNQEQMASIFLALHEVFDVRADAEITIELNPGSVSEQKLLTYKRIGINRLSIGLQTTDNEELKLLGRVHTFEQFEETYHLARKLGFQNINVDLISAIPGQTIDSWKETLSTVVKLQPEHISAYSLIIEEGTPFYEIYGDLVLGHSLDEATRLPDEEEERSIYVETRKRLERSGYRRYEISNYAREGYECRHNLGYWERKNYLGIGLGASSLIGNIRFSHIHDRERYVNTILHQKEGCTPTADIIDNRETLDQRAEMEEFMFLGLRKMTGIAKGQFYRCFGMKIGSVYGKEMHKLKTEGLLLEDEGRIWLSERGIDLSNYVLAQFLDPNYE